MQDFLNIYQLESKLKSKILGLLKDLELMKSMLDGGIFDIHFYF